MMTVTIDKGKKDKISQRQFHFKLLNGKVVCSLLHAVMTGSQNV